MKNIELFLKMALLVSKKSVAPDKQVGAIAVDPDGNIISHGYNYNTDDYDSSTVYDDGRTKPTVIHAEMDMLIRAMNSGRNLKNATLYCTHSPCMYCATHMKQSGIKRIYYLQDFKNGISHEYLNNHGIDVTQVLGIDPDIDELIQQMEDDSDLIHALNNNVEVCDCEE
jgi:dCMP deaminase